MPGNNVDDKCINTGIAVMNAQKLSSFLNGLHPRITVVLCKRYAAYPVKGLWKD